MVSAMRGRPSTAAIHVRAGVAPHRLHGEEQHEQAEHAEHRPPQATGPAGLVLERRVDQHAEQLDGEQRRAGRERKKSNALRTRENGPERRDVPPPVRLDPLLDGPDDTGDGRSRPLGSAGTSASRSRQSVSGRRQRRARWSPATALTDSVIENLVAAVVGLALLAYLVYALVRPDRF